MLSVQLVFHIAEIENDFLRAGRASEFSHNLDPKRTFTILKREEGARVRRTCLKCERNIDVGAGPGLICI
jgi:hypothetical protein